MSNVDKWERRYVEIRRCLLQKFLGMHANGQYTYLVVNFLNQWGKIRIGIEEPIEVAPPILMANGGENACRETLFRRFLVMLQHVVLTKDDSRWKNLWAILKDNCQKSLACWPLIRLVVPSGKSRTDHSECIGFQNIRVTGGEHHRWDYYYFPRWFEDEYGSDAVKREIERCR